MRALHDKAPLLGVSALASISIPHHVLAAVTISRNATENIICPGGVCAPTATDAVLNVRDLESLPAAGNVEVTTTGSGVRAGNVDLGAALTWASSGTLTLSANRYVHRAVSITGAGGLVGAIRPTSIRNMTRAAFSTPTRQEVSAAAAPRKSAG